MRVVVFGFIVGLCITGWSSSVWAQELPSYTASPSAVPIPTGDVDVCREVNVAGGGGVVPARVTFEVEPTIPGAQGYRYHFGNGILREFGADGAEYTHTYFQPKTYTMWVEVLDARGNWSSDPSCERNVEVIPDQDGSRQVACLGIEINDVPKDYGDFVFEVGEVIKYGIVAEDTKQEMELYRLAFGDDDETEQKGNVFLHRYLEEGVYRVEAGVKALGNPDWIVDNDACVVEVTVVNERIDDSDQKVSDVTSEATASGVNQAGGSNLSMGVVAFAILLMLAGVGMLVYSVRKMR